MARTLNQGLGGACSLGYLKGLPLLAGDGLICPEREQTGWHMGQMVGSVTRICPVLRKPGSEQKITNFSGGTDHEETMDSLQEKIHIDLQPFHAVSGPSRTPG